MGENNSWSTLFIIVIMVVVMVGAYFTTKFLSGKAGRSLKSRHIQVIDRVGLAKDKALFLTKVGGRCFFIGVTNQSIHTLGEIAPDELTLEKQDADQPAAKNLFGKFSDFLANAKNAPENLRKARETAKRASEQPTPPDNTTTVDDDYIDQISRAIQQRKNKAGKREGER